MTLREHCTPEKLAAHASLDRIKQGKKPTQDVYLSLAITGDAIQRVKDYGASMKKAGKLQKAQAVAHCIKLLRYEK